MFLIFSPHKGEGCRHMLTLDDLCIYKSVHSTFLIPFPGLTIRIFLLLRKTSQEIRAIFTRNGLF